MKPILILTVLCLLLPAAAASQTANSSPQDQAAQKALDTYALMVDETNYRRMGFDKPDVLQQAKLGQPIEEYNLPLDTLAATPSPADPANLIAKSGNVHYPVVLGDRVLSGVTIQSPDGESWKPSSFGDARHVRDMSKMRDQLSAEKGVGRNQIFEVAVPSKSLTFMGYREGGQLFLTPLESNPKYGFTSGVPLPANQVVDALLQTELPG